MYDGYHSSERELLEHLFGRIPYSVPEERVMSYGIKLQQRQKFGERKISYR